MEEIVITPSKKKNKKYDVMINKKNIVSFGQKGMSDYTIHKDKERKERYISRHKKREDWTKSGIDTSGFYAKNILWNKPTIGESVKDMNQKYKNIKFVYKKN